MQPDATRASPDLVNTAAKSVTGTSADRPAGTWLDSWHVDPSVNRTYDFIDGLRGIAILMVVACHYVYFKETGTPGNRLLHGFFGSLGEGVTLFFTLSGFLIAWPFWKRKANGAAKLVPPGYGWRRFWKIYPPLALSVLILTPCLILSNGNARLFIETAFQWLTGLAFVMPVSDVLNPVMWSLVVEIHFYLVLPVLFLLTRPWPPRTSLWVISLFLLVVPLAISSATGLVPVFAPKIRDPFFTGLSSFCVGVSLAGFDNLKLWKRGWAKAGDFGWLGMLSGLVGMACVGLNPGTQGTVLLQLFHWVFILGAGGLLCYAADPQNPRARWLCAPWLRWCGIISYEWYLFHQPMLLWSREFWGPATGSVLKYAVIIGGPLAASLGLSALIYRVFSLPILKFGRAQKSARKS